MGKIIHYDFRRKMRKERLYELDIKMSELTRTYALAGWNDEQNKEILPLIEEFNDLMDEELEWEDREKWVELY